MTLYQVTKLSPYFSFTVCYVYTKISNFLPVLSIRIVLDCFYLLISILTKISTDVCRMPYAVNVNLSHSIRVKFAANVDLCRDQVFHLRVLDRSLLLQKVSTM